jgi:DNA helicase HerA-like ATPase
MVSESGDSDEAAANPDGPSLADLVGDILSPEETVREEPVSTGKPKKKFKPKGMFLGTRRDTGEPIDIKPMVLARHAAMLGSTGSGKTVMAKALIEEAALAKIPSLIIDPQGDLARLALGIDLDELESQGGDVARA